MTVFEHNYPSTSVAGRIASTLARSRLCHSLNSLNKSKQWSKFYITDDKDDKVLEAVKQDHEVKTDPVHNNKRRTLLLMRKKNENFGFTVQSYILSRGGEESDVERITYVDYVAINSNAAKAGLRAGDVIVSINGKVVTDYTHEQLVKFISSCLWMRMIVMFENIRERIELTARSFQLQKLLELKLEQVKFLEKHERRLLEVQEASSSESYSLSDLRTLRKLSLDDFADDAKKGTENNESSCGTPETLTDADSLLNDGNSVNSSDISRETNGANDLLFDAVGFKHILQVDDDSDGVQITRL
ncbi:hypothetical protein L596_007395 [Steinernema carpocapsae]|uniref:PDZ domain-containing protein n=1 Tax=Steinernema carpocapsae TaxID=34508 RepID=A0A4U5P9U3_STECR|nr:hypothetical protein L596_007395 [Steinernema carpocapsae]